MGNNPVNYVDPDGRVLNSIFEKQFVQEVLGEKWLDVYEKTLYISVPEGRSGSFPIMQGVIFYSKDVYDDPMNSGERGINTFIHEIYHQVQYCTDLCAFPNLIKEFFINEDVAKNGVFLGYEYTSANNFIGTSIKKIYDGNPVMNYVYNYDTDNLSKYTSLKDLPFYESRAEFVGDFAEMYYKVRYLNELSYGKELKQMAEILKNSGFNTEAVIWAQERF